MEHSMSIAIQTVVGFSRSAVVTEDVQRRVAVARAGGGSSSGIIDVEGIRWSRARYWLFSRRIRHTGGASSGLELLGLFVEGVLDGSNRTSDVSLDSVDAVLFALDDESPAVDPESRGSGSCSNPMNLARLEMAWVELLLLLLLLVKLDMIREKSLRRLLDSEDEIEVRSW